MSNQAVYNFRIKGYLTVADLLNEVSKLPERLENSDFLKKELFDHLHGENFNKLDKHVQK